MKIVSQLDAAGYLVGATRADESPLEPGVYLIPAGCVDADPVDVPRGKCARWAGEAFVLEDMPLQQSDLPAEPPSPEQLQRDFVSAIQQRLDAFAQTRNYDSILSACTYATSTVPRFKAEGQACVNLRDATWAAAYDILGKVQAGQRAMPASLADIEADLPALVWPA